MTKQLEELHNFWFQGAGEGWPSEEQLKGWFRGSEEFDQRIRADYAGLPAELKQQQDQFDAWLAAPATATALIICFDQLPRNIFRKSGEAFAFDGLAMELAEKLSGSDLFAQLSPSQQLFALMPYQHTEQIQLQEKSLRLFDALVESAPAERREFAQGMADYARKHHELIARFGRFPHRNEALGRAPTPEEEAYLAADGERFGQ